MRTLCLIILLYVLPHISIGQVKLPNIFSDNMVLQANKPIRIWGSAKPGEKVIIILGDELKKINADKSGNWKVNFDARGYGNPFTMKVSGKNSAIELHNIVMGEVWFCSGQSNMAMTVNGDGGQVYNYKFEESKANYPLIRAFRVYPAVSETPLSDFGGKWEVCNPKSVSNSSAVAYFFAKKVFEETGIPIGIINSSWGGTDIETWTSLDAFSQFPSSYSSKYKEIIDAGGLSTWFKENEILKAAYREKLSTEVGIKEEWFKPTISTADWKSMRQPQEWSSTELSSFDGVAWFRYEFEVEDEIGDAPILLSLGKLDDNEITWINGVKVGETNGAGHERKYYIKSNIIKKGKNVLIVRIVDIARLGGFTSKDDELFININDEKISLAGDWKYKTSLETKGVLLDDVNPNAFHSLLYNAMVNPVINYPIRGFLWYQGENNAGKAFRYRTLFPALINDWRNKWGEELPFYWVQLASYLQKSNVPAEDVWAELREAQTLTLSVHNTGQIVTTDIGDANDIHPRNKQDVGYRLANIALHNLYSRDTIVFSSPTYKCYKIDNNKIRIEFDNVAQGLNVDSKYGYVEGFTIAGENKQFVWAKATLIAPNVIEVYSDEIEKPVAVRYCWSINPDVNLYNSAGLPATPFRTDNWKISTE